ncbi:EAL domain-containing protein [Clostridium sardiniense]|uniref:EAL domain-containing protein n=1 Tax=Clostridium sardiniense TaxID=29369 RepID=A0ABS7L1D0_CLOSR|nr:EAL domain-containing protein [Clostridium sardiniense]MBY0756717.1 EAL domain-containing protein [Clostridium sardiniense]MDQ0460401.1 EAL domain-containing protein (putative c-di-GMP-specific phosphodiesterase class I) [Clostridium sardiniense]
MNPSRIKNMEIVYQPKVHLKTNKVESLEALSRFFDKDNNILNTEKIIMLAREVNDMRIITNRVINKTISIIENLENDKKLNFSINISCIEIEDEFFEKWIEDLFYKYKSNYLNRLEFEITEKYKIKNKQLLKKRIKFLQDRGFLVSLDDIGAGFNKYELIYEYDVDYVKIDKSLIREINKYKDTIKRIIESSHLSNKMVVAEGIENESTYRILKNLDCDLGQGFYFYKPKKIGELNII